MEFQKASGEGAVRIHHGTASAMLRKIDHPIPPESSAIFQVTLQGVTLSGMDKAEVLRAAERLLYHHTEGLTIPEIGQALRHHVTQLRDLQDNLIAQGDPLATFLDSVGLQRKPQ